MGTPDPRLRAKLLRASTPVEGVSPPPEETLLSCLDAKENALARSKPISGRVTCYSCCPALNFRAQSSERQSQSQSQAAALRERLAVKTVVALSSSTLSYRRYLGHGVSTESEI